MLCLGIVASAQARVDLLLVPPVTSVTGQPGVEFTLYLNNPTEISEFAHLPVKVVADYATSTGHGRVRLALANPNDADVPVPPMSRKTILLRLEDPISGNGGFVSLRLTSPETNAIMFELAAAAPPIAVRSPIESETRRRSPASATSGRDLDLTSDAENMRRHISSYDPIYFALGWRNRFNARFQFSFKYRVFGRATRGQPWVEQLARDLHVAYTQTSIWDLKGSSKPFYDSSYTPTAFLLHEFEPTPASNWRIFLQAGAQHESNGKGSATATPSDPANSFPPLTPRHPSDSRSFNTLYFAPKVRWTGDNNFFVEARARTSVYFETDENPDIERYRGYVELTLRTGYDRGLQLSAHARGKPKGHGSVELNLSWPAIQTPLLSHILPMSFGGYAQVQYFNGYGESLLDYDVRRKDQLRFGMMIVR
jgi:outer membrane phospholipase A